MLKLAVFLGKEDGTDVVYGGTAFLLLVERTEKPGRMFSYIATAAHVAREHLDHVPFRVRFNVRGGQWKEESVDGTRWVYHHDKQVDVAVYPFRFPGDADIIPIALGYSDADGIVRPDDSLVLTAPMMEQLGIGVGDDVTIVGLFTKHYGTKQNVPLVRGGTLAMLPGELIDNGRKGKLWGHIIEGRSIGGISGSPVWVAQTMELKPAMPYGGTPDGQPVKPRVGGPFYFLGLMHGHWDIDPTTLNAARPTLMSPEDGGINQGIAVVVPADKVLDTLNEPSLVAMRKKLEEQDAEQEGSTTEDSGFAKHSDATLSPLTEREFTDVLRRVSRKVMPSQSDEGTK